MALEVRAVTKYIRISAQKMRLVTDLVRGMDATEALDLLQFTPKSAAKQVRKTLASAVANAEENFGLDREDLFISKISADEGPTLRRGRAGARGRYKPILRRSSHITVVLEEREA